MYLSRWTRFVVVLGIGLLLAVACSPSAPTAPVLPAGWSFRQPQDSSFRIALPDGWNVVTPSPITIPTAMALMRQQAPELVDFPPEILAMIAPSSAKLTAFDLTPGNPPASFPRSLNIVGQALPTKVSLESIVRQFKTQVEQSDAVLKPITQETFRPIAGEGVKLRYRLQVRPPDGELETGSMFQYGIMNGKDLYIVTFACPDNETEKYAPLFEKIARSFSLASQE